MNKKVLINVFLFFGLSLTPEVHAQQQTVDSLKISLSEGKMKDSYWNRLFNGNIDRTHEKKLDISFVAAPSYTREASFGIGGLASGLYRLNGTDSLMRPSNVSLSGNASVLGFYAINIYGNNYFKGNKSRLSYDIAFTTKPLDFWGISYEACATNPVIDYTRRQIKIDADYVYEVVNDFHIGATLDFAYTNVTKIDDSSYLGGEKQSCTATGLGISVQYDTRDFIPNPQRGVYLMFRETVFPEGLGNCDKTLFRSTFTADLYQKVWQGGIVAVDLYGRFNSEGAPWAMKEELGNAYRMRGYYAGRYIDNNFISCQLELRQHIIERFGCSAWFGGGTVFPSLNQLRWSHILPAYGLGLRWEFKRNVNARIDYGFGKQTGGFVFSLGEAF
ncbi:MAG: outer membrane protein assembly factor [Candidatus Symbiothrix sp.]|jgi:outer membrane protein assembly factor BamA|nr:outer membrane protein assembly factor [Candidatus Symbiothrix sp.]